MAAGYGEPGSSFPRLALASTHPRLPRDFPDWPPAPDFVTARPAVLARAAEVVRLLPLAVLAVVAVCVVAVPVMLAAAVAGRRGVK
jgi:hypothetical protein